MINRRIRWLLFIVTALSVVLLADSFTQAGGASMVITPNDAYYDLQWGLVKTHAPAAWEYTTGNTNVRIGILDKRGVNFAHPDLGRASGDTCLMGYPHGTPIAGIIGATTNNGIGVAGINWVSDMFSANPFDDQGKAIYMVEKMNWLIDTKQVNVLNASVEILSDSTSLWPTAKAFAHAYNSDCVCVVSAGNCPDLPCVAPIEFPACFPGMLVVGGVDVNEDLYVASKRGSDLDVVGPAVNVFSTMNNGYGADTGTSFAAPFAAGLASLLRGYHDSLSNDDIAGLICASARDIGAHWWSDSTGWGLIDMGKAFRMMQDPYRLIRGTADGGTSVAQSGVLPWTLVGVDTLADGRYSVTQHTVTRAVTFPRGFYDVPRVWGRGAATTGYAQPCPIRDTLLFGFRYCDVVLGSVTRTGCTLRTYVYRVTNQSGDTAWVPCRPEQVTFAYSALGVTSYVCGDADLSGSIDISDAVYVLSYIFSGGPAPIPLVAGDANCDSLVDVSDVVYLISYIFSGGPAPCAGCQ